MLRGRASGRNLAVAGIFLLSGLAALELFNFYEKRSTFRKSRIARNNPLLLFFITLLGLTAHITAFLLWNTNWLIASPVLDCNALVQGGVVLMYVVIKQFIYLFLFERVKVVHDALHLKDRTLIAFRWIVFAFATTGIPLAMYPLIFIYFRGSVIVVKNGTIGICFQHATNQIPVFFLAVADLLMSITLLVLFVLPLFKHIRRNVTADATRLYSLAKRNTIISLLMTIMTFLAMMFLAVYGVQPDPTQMLHFQGNTVVAQLSDILVCTILAHFLSSGWVPGAIKKRMRITTSSKASRTDPNASSKNAQPVRMSKEITVSVRSSSNNEGQISPRQVRPDGPQPFPGTDA